MPFERPTRDLLMSGGLRISTPMRPPNLYGIIYLLDDRIRTEEDIERYLGLSVLGDIPNADDKKSHQYGYYKAYGSHEQKKNRKKRRAK